MYAQPSGSPHPWESSREEGRPTSRSSGYCDRPSSPLGGGLSDRSISPSGYRVREVVHDLMTRVESLADENSYLRGMIYGSGGAGATGYSYPNEIVKKDSSIPISMGRPLRPRAELDTMVTQWLMSVDRLLRETSPRCNAYTRPIDAAMRCGPSDAKMGSSSGRVRFEEPDVSIRGKGAGSAITGLDRETSANLMMAIRQHMEAINRLRVIFCGY